MTPNIEYYEQLACVYHLFFEDLQDSMVAEGRWLGAMLAPRRVRRVLDASCGTGRQTIPLARMGYAVTAVDPSEAMLEIARRAARDAGVDVEWHCAPFHGLPARFGPDFDAVIAMGNSLCHAGGPPAIVEALVALGHCVRDGGICVLGIKDFEEILTQRRRFHPHRIVDGPEGRTILFEVWDYRDPLLEVSTFLVREMAGGWSVDVARACEYMLGPDELACLSASAGFRTCTRVSHVCEAAYVLEK